jgi:hypothetical protein
MKLRQLTIEEVEFKINVDQDFLPVRGNAMSSGNEDFDRKAEDEILADLDRGNVWAWADAEVVASWNGFSGSVRLGCCSYKSEEDFRQCEYYWQMKTDSLNELNKNIAETFEMLQSLTLSPADLEVKV